VRACGERERRPDLSRPAVQFERQLQILTLAELFQGKRPDIPWVDAGVLRSARREEQGKQGKLL